MEAVTPGANFTPNEYKEKSSSDESSVDVSDSNSLLEVGMTTGGEDVLGDFTDVNDDIYIVEMQQQMSEKATDRGIIQEVQAQMLHNADKVFGQMLNTGLDENNNAMDDILSDLVRDGDEENIVENAFLDDNHMNEDDNNNVADENYFAQTKGNDDDSDAEDDECVVVAPPHPTTAYL